MTRGRGTWSANCGTMAGHVRDLVAPGIGHGEVDRVGPGFHLAFPDLDHAVPVFGEEAFAELPAPVGVRPLSHEKRGRLLAQLLEAVQAGTRPVVPRRPRAVGRMPARAFFRAAMCAGQVPQQPPTRLTPYCSTNFRRSAAKSSGTWCRQGPVHIFGEARHWASPAPARGSSGTAPARGAPSGRGPVAQLMPMMSTDSAEQYRYRSLQLGAHQEGAGGFDVTLAATGRRTPRSACASLTAQRHALICSGSWQVSRRNRSTPPSRSPCSAGRYDS